MTDVWQTRTLAQVARIRPPKNEARARLPHGGDVSFLPMEALQANSKYVNASSVRSLDSVAGSYTYFADGDVLLPKISPCFENGKMGIARNLVNGMGFGSSEYIVFRPHEGVSAEWLYYYLSRAEMRDEGTALTYGAVGQRRLPKDFVENYPIPVPPLLDQQRIVAILDEAFEGIATARADAEKNLKNARAVFESHLASVFTQRDDGWVQTTLGESVRFIDYRGKTPKKTEGGLRLITAKNVKMGYVQQTPEEFVAPETYDGWMTRGIPKRGDVLFTTEAPLANVASLDTDEKVVFAQRIIIMQPDDTKLRGAFLKYLLLSQPVQHRIHAKGTGATVKGIKASLLKTVEVSFPESLAVQEQVVAKLDSLNNETLCLESVYQRKLSALDTLKQSLLHHAFSGQL